MAEKVRLVDADGRPISVSKEAAKDLLASGQARDLTQEEAGRLNSLEASKAIREEAGKSLAVGGLVGLGEAAQGAVPGLGLALRAGANLALGQKTAQDYFDDYELGKSAWQKTALGGGLFGALGGLVVGNAGSAIGKLGAEGSSLAKLGAGMQRWGGIANDITMAPFLGAKFAWGANSAVQEVKGLASIGKLFGEGGGLARNIGRYGTEMGVYGAMSEAADQLGESFVSKDPTFDGKKIFWSGLTGAGMGGLFGAAATGLARGQKSLQKTANETPGLTESLLKDSDILTAQTAKERGMLPGGDKRLMEYSRKTGVELESLLRDPQAMRKAQLEIKKDSGKALETYLHESAPKVNAGEFVDDLMATVRGKGGSGQAIATLEARAPTEVGSMLKKAGLVTRQNEKEVASLLLDDASNFRTYVKEARAGGESLQTHIDEVNAFNRDYAETKLAVKAETQIDRESRKKIVESLFAGNKEAADLAKSEWIGNYIATGQVAREGSSTVPTASGLRRTVKIDPMMVERLKTADEEFVTAASQQSPKMQALESQRARIKRLESDLKEMARLGGGDKIEDAKNLVDKIGKGEVHLGKHAWEHKKTFQPDGWVGNPLEQDVNQKLADAMDETILNHLEKSSGPASVEKVKSLKGAYATDAMLSKALEESFVAQSNARGFAHRGASGVTGTVSAGLVGLAGLQASPLASFYGAKATRELMDRAAHALQVKVPVWRAKAQMAMNDARNPILHDIVNMSEEKLRSSLEKALFYEEKVRTSAADAPEPEKNPTFVFGKTDAERQKNMSALISKIGRPDMAISDYVQSLGDLPRIRPQTAASMAQTYGQAINFLASVAPQKRDRAFSLLPWQSDTYYTQMEIQRFARFAEASLEPTKALARLADGSLKREHVEALSAVHPGFTEYIKGQLQDIVTDLKHADKIAKMGLNRRMQLARFFGIGGRGLRDPNFFMAIQASFGTAPAEGQPQPPPHVGPSTNGSMVGTEMDRRADGNFESLR